MSVDPVRKALYIVAVAALFVVFCGYAPAGEINHEPLEPGRFRRTHNRRSSTPVIGSSTS